MKIAFLTFVLLVLVLGNTVAQSLSGKVLTESGQPIASASIQLQGTPYNATTDDKGIFSFEILPKNKYTLLIFSYGFVEDKKIIDLNEKDIQIEIVLKTIQHSLNEVVIEEEKNNDFGIGYMNAVEWTAIYASKKNEVILMDDVAANKATNNSRQVFSKVSGLNIWESDPAGIQLGIGGRGLNPNRTTNFNTRQNGYDISADALGYPESYYTPPTEGLERIEVIRGAASLQYGTQFGGVVNFIMKKGNQVKPIETTLRQTVGSFGLLNSFGSVGGTKNRFTYYGFVQHKQGKGWRANSNFNVNTGYINIGKTFNEKLAVNMEYTHMNYLAQQAGGLTDKQFNENPKASTRNRNWFDVSWNLGAMLLEYKINSKTILSSKSFGLYSHRNALGELGRIDRPDPMGNRDLISGYFKNFGNETKLLHRYTLFQNLPSSLLVGTRYYNGNTSNKQGDANSKATPDFIYLSEDNLSSDYLFKNKNIALFAENVFNIGKKFSVTPGVRYEYIKTQANGNYTADVLHPNTNQVLLKIEKTENNQSSRNIVLCGLGASYKPKSNFELYANFSQNYRAINFSDIKIVNPSFRVDSTITDEKGWNTDLGFRGRIKNFVAFDATLFCLNYDNRIGSVMKNDPITYQTYRYRTNIGSSRNIGVESFIEIDALKAILSDSIPYGISIFSNIALINAEYINSMDASIKKGNKVEYAPFCNLKAGTSLSFKKIKLTYQYTYVSKQFTEATNAPKALSIAIDGPIPSYTISDISLSYSYKRYALECGINNLFNKMYFTRRASAYPGPGIIPSDGRSFYLTLQVKL